MTLDDIALTFVPRLGHRGAMHLLDSFGSAEAIYRAPYEQLAGGEVHLRPDVAKSICSRAGFAEAAREMEYCRRNAIRPVASTDDEYPEALRAIADAPHVIYVLGDVGALASLHTLSMVGTRRMTPYGERMCNRLVEGLSVQLPDAVVVSGLAFGTDAAAHRAAIAYGLRTVGVLANALPAVTPSQNTALAKDMLAHGGALVSEVSSQTRQNGSLFIPRNRIIAGLSQGLVVVESATDGGSLSTARYADGYSRTVMAVPGRATDLMSSGTNMLIRNRTAQMVLTADDVAAELGWTPDCDAPGASAAEEMRSTELRAAMSEEQLRVLECFGEGGGGESLEGLVARTGFDTGTVTLALLELELAGAVKALPGQMYEKLI